MATFVGQTYVPQTPRRDENFQLLSQVMMMKQGKYDANRAKVQETLDAFGSIDLLRDEDKEYLSNKLGSITDNINGMGNLNFSNPSVNNSIMSDVKAAASDPIVQSAIQNTRKYRTFQQQVATQKEKNPEQYSDINYSYALANAGVDKYMSGEAKEIGKLEYTPYTDYNKKINDTVIDLLGKKGEKTIQTRDGNGQIIETKIDGMSPSQLKQVAKTMLDVNDMKQIEIDGWYNSGGYENPSITENIDSILGESISMLDSGIAKAEISLESSDPNSDAYRKNKALLDKMTEERNSVQKNYEILSKSPKAAATYLQKEKVLADIVNRFSPLYTESTLYKKDDAWYAQKNLELAISKEKRLSGASAGTSQTISQVSLGTGELQDLEDIETTIDGRLNELHTDLGKGLLKYKNLLQQEADKGNPTAKTKIQELKKRLDANKTRKETDVLQEFFFDMDRASDPMVLMDENGNNILADLRETSSQILLYEDSINDIDKKYRQLQTDKTLNTEQYFEAVYKNPNTKMLWNGGAVPVYKVLQEEGLMSIDGKGNVIKTGDLNSKPKVLDELVKSYYIDASLNDATTGTLTLSERPSWDEESTKTVKELASLYGESFEEVMDVQETEGGAKIYRPNLNTQTGIALMNGRSEGVYDSFGFSDQSLTGDDSTIGEFYNNDYKQSVGYREELSGFRDKLADQQSFSVSYNTDKATFDNIVQLAQAKSEAGGESFIRDTNTTVNFRKEGNEIVITQRPLDGSKTKLGGEVRVSVEEFRRNLPELSDRYNFSSKASIYTQERLRGRELPSEPIKYIRNNSTELYEWSSEGLLADQPQLVPFLKQEDTKSVLYRKYAPYIEQYPDLKQVIDRAVLNSENYSVSLKIGGGMNGIPRLHMNLKDLTGNTVYTYTKDNVFEADNFKRILDNAPQVYYSFLLDKILEEQRNSLSYGNNSSNYTNFINSLNTNRQ